MNAQEKLEQWAVFTKAFPFLIPNPRGLSSLHYRGTKLLSYTENLFYRRAFYGSFHVGGASPFYSIYILCHPPRWNEPSITFETDIATLSWQRIEDLHEASLRFFRFLKSDTATRIKAMTWPPKSIVDLRMWIGATLYLRDTLLPTWVVTLDKLIARLQKPHRKGT
jgi:hypothetical protein